MSDEVYEKHVQSIITIKMEKPKNLYQEACRYWYYIVDGDYEFSQSNDQKYYFFL